MNIKKTYLGKTSTGVKLYSNPMTGEYKDCFIFISEKNKGDFSYIAVKDDKVIKEDKSIENIWAFIDFYSLV